jgi:hypothetical protein
MCSALLMVNRPSNFLNGGQKRNLTAGVSAITVILTLI